MGRILLVPLPTHSLRLLLAVPGTLPLAIVLGAEGSFVRLGARRIAAESIDGQRHPTVRPPVPTQALHAALQHLTQQGDELRGPFDQGVHQTLVGADRHARQQRTTLFQRTGEGIGQIPLIRPCPQERQPKEIQRLPFGIAMKRKVGKDVGAGKKPLTQTSEVLTMSRLIDPLRGPRPLPSL